MTALPQPTEPAESGPVGASAESDAELLERVRSGDKQAYGALWDRHHRAGISAARAITSAFDADDLVSEAFVRVLKAIERGNGPTAAFRPYLVTTIRSVAARWGAQPNEITPDELEVVDPDSSDEAFSERFDQSLTVRAFNTLPQRWQEVLWYTEAEQLPPREVAAMIGIKPNAVSALAKRAKEGLRHAWVQAHISTVPENSECRWSIDRLAASTRKALPAREQERLDAHLDECDRCPLAAAEMTAASRRLGALILIGFLGGGAATAYAAMLKPAAATAAAIGGGAAGGKAAGAAVAGKVTWVRNASIAAGGAVAAAAVAGGIAFASGAFAPAHHSASSAVAAAGSSSSAQAPSDSSTDASPAAPSKPSPSTAAAPPAARGSSEPHEPAVPVVPAAPPAQDPAPVAVSAVDTGDGLYYPILNGTGAPGSTVTATQAAAANAPALARGRMGTVRPALAHPGAAFVTTVAAATRSSSTTVGQSGTFTLGPLNWVQPDADGNVRLTVTQRSPSGDTTTTAVTARMPKQTLGLSAPLASSGSQLTISGATGATVEVLFSQGTERKLVLDGSGHGSTAIPAGATAAKVVYVDPKTGRTGAVRTVKLNSLPVAQTGGTPGDNGQGGSTPGGGSGHSDPGNGNGNGNGSDPGNGNTNPGDGDSASPEVTDVTADTGAAPHENELFPIISGKGVPGATVYAVVGAGRPDGGSVSTVVDASGHFRFPELDALPAGDSTVTVYQRVSDAAELSVGVPVTVTLKTPAARIVSSGFLGADKNVQVTGVANAYVKVELKSLFMSSTSVVELDGSGHGDLPVTGFKVLPVVTAYYVDGQDAVRRGPESSDSTLPGVLSTPAVQTELSVYFDRFFGRLRSV
ncbi:hypothetical protein GCM10022288_18640 [Gryllotalpicola kribbensis]|uniref:Sigma-70 family RNA polymerase sigma factor n=1 Tax=Gryllotalpicola kribbensis TaxID=993084 RepID=A0ABP8ATP6_9MICO